MATKLNEQQEQGLKRVFSALDELNVTDIIPPSPIRIMEFGGEETNAIKYAFFLTSDPISENKIQYIIWTEEHHEDKDIAYAVNYVKQTFKPVFVHIKPFEDVAAALIGHHIDKRHG